MRPELTPEGFRCRQFGSDSAALHRLRHLQTGKAPHEKLHTFIQVYVSKYADQTNVSEFRQPRGAPTCLDFSVC